MAHSHKPPSVCAPLQGGSRRNTPKFWDKIAAKYAKSPIKNMDAYNQTLDRTRTHLSDKDTALEIGCGTGSTAVLLAGSVKHLIANDLSPNMLSIAETKANDQKLTNLSFLQGDVFNDALKPGSFDVILAFNLLHLVEDLPSVMQRLHTLLAPGGRFISKTPCIGEQTRLWKIPLSVLTTFGVVPFVNCLTFDELETVMKSSGFRIAEADCFKGSKINRFMVASSC